VCGAPTCLNFSRDKPTRQAAHQTTETEGDVRDSSVMHPLTHKEGRHLSAHTNIHSTAHKDSRPCISHCCAGRWTSWPSLQLQGNLAKLPRSKAIPGRSQAEGPKVRPPLSSAPNTLVAAAGRLAGWLAGSAHRSRQTRQPAAHPTASG